MPKFFQHEIGAHAGEKQTFQNVEFKKNNFQNSAGAEIGSLFEVIPVHIKNPPQIQFIAYIESLSDNFKVGYDSEQPFGRTDPYQIWKSNKRDMSLTLGVPSSSVSKGLDNLNNISWLLASLYPTYKDRITATSISASPLFRVRYANLISTSVNDGQGLLCTIGSVGVTHDLDKGVIHVNPLNMGSSFANVSGRLLKEAKFEENVNEGKSIIIPKLIKLSLSLTVIHDHSLGWDHSTGNWRGGLTAPRFPYDFGLERSEGGPPINPPEAYESTGPNQLENENFLDLANTPAGAPGTGEGFEP